MLFGIIYIIGVIFCMGILMKLFIEFAREGRRISAGDYGLAVIASSLSWIMVILIVGIILFGNSEDRTQVPHVRN